MKSERGEFEQHEMRLPIYNNQILLETIEKRLDLHKPPLRVNSVNNVPAVAHPADKTLAIELQDGQRLDLVAEIAPGIKHNVMPCITHLLSMQSLSVEAITVQALNSSMPIRSLLLDLQKVFNGHGYIPDSWMQTHLVRGLYTCVGHLFCKLLQQ